MTFERLPARISAGTTTYYKTGSSSIGAQYVNERDPADVVSITTIYSSSSTEVSTNAGHFNHPSFLCAAPRFWACHTGGK